MTFEVALNGFYKGFTALGGDKTGIKQAAYGAIALPDDQEERNAESNDSPRRAAFTRGGA
jgi:hypothetical protein